MPGSKPIEKRLADLELRLRRLEAAAGLESKSGKAPSQKPSSARTLPDHIIALRDSHFFSAPRTAEEVHKKLQATYHCEPNRVAVALSRLASKKRLRKASRRAGGRSYKAYVW